MEEQMNLNPQTAHTPGMIDELQTIINRIAASDPIAQQIIMNYGHLDKQEKEMLWNLVRKLAQNL